MNIRAGIEMRISSPAIGGSGGSPDAAETQTRPSWTCSTVGSEPVANCVRAPDLSDAATQPASDVFATQTEPPPAVIRSGSAPAGTACCDAEVGLAQLVDLVLADDRDPDRAAVDRQVADERVQLRVRSRSCSRSGRSSRQSRRALAAQTAPSAYTSQIRIGREVVETAARSADRRGPRRRRRRARVSPSPYAMPDARRPTELETALRSARAGVDAENACCRGSDPRAPRPCPPPTAMRSVGRPGQLDDARDPSRREVDAEQTLLSRSHPPAGATPSDPRRQRLTRWRARRAGSREPQCRDDLSCSRVDQVEGVRCQRDRRRLRGRGRARCCPA